MLVFSFSNFAYNLHVSLTPIRQVYADTNPHIGSFSPERIWTAAANVNLNLRQPDPRNGDLMVATIAIRPAASTINTPAGWTLVGSRTGTDGGAEGADAGSVGLYWFTKISNGTEGTSNQTFTENGTTSVWMGTIMQVRSASGTYDTSLGAVTINGNTTNWGGTLDTDIGLTAEDLVIMVAAQNGDRASVTAQGISATGVTTFATTREHGEFQNTTGNDIEMDLSSTQVWAGTSVATPTITTTLSVAASGVNAVLRIRQGAGSNRTDTWIKSAGIQIQGTTALNIAYTDHEIGDMLLIFVVNRPNGPIPTIASGGWVNAGSYTGGAGLESLDSGTVRVTVFYVEASSRFTTTRSVAITAATGSVGQMLAVHKNDVVGWSFDVDGGSDLAPGTSWSVAGGAGIDLDNVLGGDLVIIGTAINTDAYTFSNHVISATGITFNDTTQVTEFRASTGNDQTVEISSGRVVVGSSSPVITFTSTASGSTANAPAGASVFLKVLGLIPTFEQSAYRFFANANSEDVGAALASQDTLTTLTATGDAFRLRMLVHVGAAQLGLSGENFKLQFAEKSGTCDTGFTGESYADVTGATVIAYNNNASPADGDNLISNANDPTHGGDTIVNQDYEELNNFTNSVSAIDAGQDGKWDFSLIDNGATADTSYCFRIVKSDDSQIDTYTVIPEVTTASAGGPPQSISFNISDNSIGFGTLSSSGARYATGDISGSASDSVDAHTITASTNATGGYVISINGSTLTCSACGGATVSPIGAPPASSSAGSEQFGLRTVVNSGTGTTVSPYNQASQFAFDSGSFPDTVISGDGDDVSSIFGIRYLGNISNTTDAGSYTSVLTYTITAGF